MPDAVDQSWSRTTVEAAKAAGVTVVSGYLSNDASKNWSADWIRRYHAAGIGCLLNWEALPGAPLNGASQGTEDAKRAVAELRALIAQTGTGPKNRVVIYFSCDSDADPAKVEPYYRAAGAVCRAAGFGVGVYGSARVVAHLSKLGLTDAEWQTYAWSNGVLDPAADFYQYQNGQKIGGASVDFDRVIHVDELGAWWPASSAHNVDGKTAVVTDFAEAVTVMQGSPDTYKQLLDDVRAIVNAPLWHSARDGKPHTPDTVIRQAVQDDAGGKIDRVEAKVNALTALLSAPAKGILDRVASLQAAVAAVKPAAAQVTVDAASVASQIVESMKTLVWKAA